MIEDGKNYFIEYNGYYLITTGHEINKMIGKKNCRVINEVVMLETEELKPDELVHRG